MDDDFSNWNNMLEGWIPHHLDEHGHGKYLPAPPTLPPAPKWRGKARPPTLEGYDIEERVSQVIITLAWGYSESVYTPIDVEGLLELLDEIQAYAEKIDVVKELHTDGLLSTFLTLLYNKHANVRAKAAEVVTTMVQKYPTSRQFVIEWKFLKVLLYNLTADPDATSVTKALGAISALLRNNKPGITEFQNVNGYAFLWGPLSSESVTLQRDALNLLHYLLHENSSDCSIVEQLGLTGIIKKLAYSDDAEVREAFSGVDLEFKICLVLTWMKMADDSYLRAGALRNLFFELNEGEHDQLKLKQVVKILSERAKSEDPAMKEKEKRILNSLGKFIRKRGRVHLRMLERRQ